ncbi:MAG: glucose-1-phosphate thymidylyltransferase, partial [Thermoguttaceae bacterium]|nr:glucose-1-phosphate thymidylyltransferase [Thermoguttaceae bacterium]
MDVIVFEDDLVHQLYPLTIGRPAFAVSCGSYRLIDLVTRLGRPVEVVVRPHLKTITAADHPGVGVNPGAGKGPVLMVNARLVPSVAA